MNEKQKYLDLLDKSGACGPAMRWMRKTKGSPKQLWRRCSNAAWMSWYLDEVYCVNPENLSKDAIMAIYKESWTLVPDTDNCREIIELRRYPPETFRQYLIGVSLIGYELNKFGHCGEREHQNAMKMLKKMAIIIRKHIPTLPEFSE